jgi:hypothetical protein
MSAAAIGERQILAVQTKTMVFIEFLTEDGRRKTGDAG